MRHKFSELFAHTWVPLIHWRGIGIEIHEKKAVEILCWNFVQAYFGPVKSGHGFNVWP